MLKNKKPLSLIIFFLIFIALIGVISLIILVVLGYSGFKPFNAKSSILTLQLGCNNSYFNQKYGNAVNTVMKISYIFNISAIFLSIAFLLYLMMVVYQAEKKIRSRKTIINSQTQSKNLAILQEATYHPNHTTLFILGSLLVISTYTPFCHFLQYRIELDNTVCPLNGNSIELDTFAILMGLMFIFSILAFVAVIASLYLSEEKQVYSERQRKIPQKIKSPSDEEIQSQRRMVRVKTQSEPFSVRHHMQEQPVISDEVRSREAAEMFGSKEEDHKIQEKNSYKSDHMHGISTIQKVQSVLEIKNPELNLESNIQRRD